MTAVNERRRSPRKTCRRGEWEGVAEDRKDSAVKCTGDCPVIGHIPHASILIPPDVRQSLAISGDDLTEELRRVTDWYVDELFVWLGDRAVVCPVSRLVVDVERFDNDEDEVMASRGMGAVYTKTSDGRPLRSTLTDGERTNLLDRFYHPHHREAEQRVQACLDQYGRCLILDCHSFPSQPLPVDLNQDSDRPHICLGTDPFHTPLALTTGVTGYFTSLGLTVFHDKPYGGTYVPVPFLAADRRVSSLMIEINRSLYMDETTGNKEKSFEMLRYTMGGLEGYLGKLNMLHKS